MNQSDYEIAGWRFDPAEPVLRGDDGYRSLEHRAARVLALLCKKRGEVVSKEELIEEVWGGRTVSANSVSIVMGSLRRALGDDPGNPTIIVTVARRGYRLIEYKEATVPEVSSPLSGPTRAAMRRWLAGGVLALIAVVALLVYRPVEPLTLSVEPTRNAVGQPSLDGLAASLTPVVIHGVGRLRGVRLLDETASERSRVIIGSKLILWNGAPELALRATDTKTHTLIWTAFVAGPPALLARHIEDKIATLAPHLPR